MIYFRCFFTHSAAILLSSERHIHELLGSQTRVIGYNVHTVYAICSKWAKTCRKSSIILQGQWCLSFNPHTWLLWPLCLNGPFMWLELKWYKAGGGLLFRWLFIWRASPFTLSGLWSMLSNISSVVGYYGSTPAECVQIYYNGAFQGELGFLSHCQSGFLDAFDFCWYISQCLWFFWWRIQKMHLDLIYIYRAGRVRQVATKSLQYETNTCL